MSMRSTVTRAEWDVLEVLWTYSPASAREVFDRLPENRKGSVQAARTLLERLVAKKAVERRNAHGVWIFTPLRGREDVVWEEGSSFLERCFGGRAEFGAAYFIENAEMPPEELLRLKLLLENRLREVELPRTKLPELKRLLEERLRKEGKKEGEAEDDDD